MFLFRELSPQNKKIILAGFALTAGYIVYKCEFENFFGVSIFTTWLLEIFLDRESKKPRVVGHIDQLFIYPLKSGEGIDIPFAHAADQFRILWFGLSSFI